MSLILPTLPENLSSLHKEEERIRTESLLTINGDVDLKTYIDSIQHALNTIHDLTIVHKHRSDDELAIQFLGIRLFNTIVCSLKLLLSGYYQMSLAIQRDALEIQFLLDYFSHDITKIALWRKSTSEQRRKEFRPEKVRDALDKRDGFQEKKRQKQYQMFCECATHPTYLGMKLVAPKGMGEIGPFLDSGFLKNSLFELTKLSLHSTVIYMALFPNLPSKFLVLKETFLETTQTWVDKYRNRIG